MRAFGKRLNYEFLHIFIKYAASQKYRDYTKFKKCYVFFYEKGILLITLLIAQRRPSC